MTRTPFVIFASHSNAQVPPWPDHHTQLSNYKNWSTIVFGQSWTPHHFRKLSCFSKAAKGPFWVVFSQREHKSQFTFFDNVILSMLFIVRYVVQNCKSKHLSLKRQPRSVGRDSGTPWVQLITRARCHNHHNWHPLSQAVLSLAQHRTRNGATFKFSKCLHSNHLIFFLRDCPNDVFNVSHKRQRRNSLADALAWKSFITPHSLQYFLSNIGWSYSLVLGSHV